jgi:hypothetical protein
VDNRRVVVGFSGGVTSAWCGGWALRHYAKDEVVFLFHDTKEEDPDTYRFLREMAAKLDHPITERSDGRSVTELAYDEGMIPNNRAPFCSRILKGEVGERYLQELRNEGVTEIIKVYGFSEMEPDRVQRHTAMGWAQGFIARFPMIEEKVSKQQAADWCKCEMGVALPDMYEWSDHANCTGCFRGGKAYWLAVKEHRPKVFEQRKALEAEFGHTISGRYSLVQIEQEGLKRVVGRKEAIDIGPCECGG